MVALQSYAMLIALAGMGQVSGGETVLLNFTADWCGPCQSMKPVVQQLQSAGYPVRVVNIDRNRGLAAQYRVTSIPCFVMLAGGKEIDRELGATSQGRLIQMFSQAQSQQAAQPRALAQSPDDGSVPIALASQHGTAPRAGAAPATRAVAVSPAQGTGNLEQKLIRAAVRLKVEDPDGHSYGTGTIVDAQGDEALVLTCGHIFRDSQGKGKVLIDLEGGHGPRQVEGVVISFDLKRDLGLVSFRPGGPVEVARIAPGEHQVQSGDRVLNVGCNNGDAASVRRSHVTSIDKYLGPPNIEVAGMPVEGRSGGGLFNEQGQLIGVCFAADPAANEGVYAGLASIHAELDRLGLGSIYATTPTAQAQAPSAAPLVSVDPPAMPRQMPQAALAPTSGHAGAGPATAAQLSTGERAALAELAERAGDAEVICIIRPRNNPNAKSEIIVLNHASPLFLEQLSKQQTPPRDPHLTSLDVPSTKR